MWRKFYRRWIGWALSSHLSCGIVAYNQIYNWTNMSWNSCSFIYKSDYSGVECLPVMQMVPGSKFDFEMSYICWVTFAIINNMRNYFGVLTFHPCFKTVFSSQRDMFFKDHIFHVYWFSDDELFVHCIYIAIYFLGLYMYIYRFVLVYIRRCPLHDDGRMTGDGWDGWICHACSTFNAPCTSLYALNWFHSPSHSSNMYIGSDVCDDMRCNKLNCDSNMSDNAIDESIY